MGDLSNPQRLNRYAYVLNNPINFIDPDGANPWSAIWDALKNIFGGGGQEETSARPVLGPDDENFVQNGGADFPDPFSAGGGESNCRFIEIRRYDAFGIEGFNHVYFVLPTGEEVGTNASSSWVSPVDEPDSPEEYSDVILMLNPEDFPGMSQGEIVERIKTYPGWNTFPYLPRWNDCHDQACGAIRYAGGQCPPQFGSGRTDWDDRFSQMSDDHFWPMYLELQRWIETTGGRVPYP